MTGEDLDADDIAEEILTKATWNNRPLTAHTVRQAIVDVLVSYGATSEPDEPATSDKADA